MAYCRMGWRCRRRPKPVSRCWPLQVLLAWLPFAASCWDDLQVPRGSPTPSGGTASADGQRSHCPLSPWSKAQAWWHEQERSCRSALRLQAGSSPRTWSQLHPEDPPMLLNRQDPEHKAVLLTATATMPLSPSQWSQLQIAAAHLKGPFQLASTNDDICFTAKRDPTSTLDACNQYAYFSGSLTLWGMLI